MFCCYLIAPRIPPGLASGPQGPGIRGDGWIRIDGFLVLWMIVRKLSQFRSESVPKSMGFVPRMDGKWAQNEVLGTLMKIE